jgi:alkylated DNA repair dioxygenase AlkB
MMTRRELSSEQWELFARRPALPAGFAYAEAAISSGEERALAAELGALPLKPFDFHGYLGKRRVVSYGWRYDYGAAELQPASAIPAFLLPLRRAAAAFAGLAPERLEHVLVTEYAAGAGIGWHRDKAEFDDVIAISLLAPCNLRFRRRTGARWERASLTVQPRSVYLLRGPALHAWEHSIPALEGLRYSITFRSLAGLG